MLKVEDLRKHYGDFTAVDGISFEVANGECFGLLGPNGAGKTTTISMIAGVKPPDGGSLSLNGISSITDPAKVKRKIGYVPQEIALYPEIDAKENLRFFGSLYDLFGQTLTDKINQVLAQVGLEDRANEPISRFSGGMKRRLNIAAGLLHDPELIILDEPTAGVDPQSRNAIFETLESLRANGATLLYTTHYMEEVERLCQRVAIMDHGKIVACGDLQDLKSSEGDRSVVSVQLANEPTDAQKMGLCTELGARFEGSLLVVQVKDLSRDITSLLAQLSAAGLEPISLKTSEASLEQVFLLKTGRKLRD